VSKYCDHTPLYRQSQIFARHGIEIERSTLANWVGGACWWLEPLQARLAAHVFGPDKIFADDTPIPVLDPGRGRTKTGRLWVYTRDDRAPPFDRGSPIAAEALRRIAELYAIEASIRGRTAGERRSVRNTQSRPLVEATRPWLETQLGRIPGRGGLADAIRYTLFRWPALCHFLDDGRMELDNNSVERAIRPVALGRKNHLFAGSDGGAERWATVCSLIASAKLNDVEPFTYLRDILQRMTEGHPMSRLDELLRWNCPKMPVKHHNFHAAPPCNTKNAPHRRGRAAAKGLRVWGDWASVVGWVRRADGGPRDRTRRPIVDPGGRLRVQRKGSNLLASLDGHVGTARPLSIDTVWADLNVTEVGWSARERAAQSTPKRATVQPKVDLHREPGVLDRVVQIASTSQLDVAADRAQRSAAAEVERAVCFHGAVNRPGERGQA
jgi:Transposase IS66 family/IS66 C-terminal element